MLQIKYPTVIRDKTVLRKVMGIKETSELRTQRGRYNQLKRTISISIDEEPRPFVKTVLIP